MRAIRPTTKSGKTVMAMKMDYFTLMGLMSGAMTDPPALAYANTVATNDRAAVAYATVYPLTMFLRIFAAQILALIAMSMV